MLGDPFGVPASCHVTAGVLISPPRPPETKLPDYGFGRGPVYLSGQNGWYAAGQEALLLVAPNFSGAVTVGGHLNGGRASPAFDGRPTVQILAGSRAPYWRYWDGRLAFPTAGCYSLTISGTGIDDVVVVYAHDGAPPPG